MRYINTSGFQDYVHLSNTVYGKKACVTVSVELEEPSLTVQVLYMQDNINGWGLDRQLCYTDVRAD